MTTIQCLRLLFSTLNSPIYETRERKKGETLIFFHAQCARLILNPCISRSNLDFIRSRTTIIKLHSFNFCFSLFFAVLIFGSVSCVTFCTFFLLIFLSSFYCRIEMKNHLNVRALARLQFSHTPAQRAYSATQNELCGNFRLFF